MPEKTCAREGCENKFHSYPSQNKKYCSSACRYSCTKYRDKLADKTEKHSISEVNQDTFTGLCSVCGFDTPVKPRTDSERWRCQNQVRRLSRLSLYNLSDHEFQGMLSLQNNACAICKEAFVGEPCVDHDHSCCPGKKSCGKCVRGLLCTPCNKGLGSFKDNLQILEDAMKYLAPSHENWPWEA